MDSATYEELKKLLENLSTERDVLVKKIEENNISIREASSHAESILNEDTDDFKVFSPRTAEKLHREELEQLEQKKSEFQQQNNLLFHDRNKLNVIIDLLEKVEKDESNLGEDKSLMIIKIQEEERQRIARDLHDTSLQNLAHLVHKIELASLFIDQDPVRAKLELVSVNKNLRETINDIRNTIFNLRPMTLDDLGLKTAFERLFARLNAEKQFKLDLQIDNVSCENELLTLTIYRIVYEALNNIYKHAEADEIVFRCLQEDDICVVEIADNGKGFSFDDLEERSERHFGLSLMEERVHLLRGKIEIVPQVNVGTKIRIEIPLT